MSILNVLASVSQWEREAIGERTSAAMQHKASLGEYIRGDLPYGYMLAPDGQRLLENPEEQKVLVAARNLQKLRAVSPLGGARAERIGLSEQDGNE